ncbi:MAG: sigma-70 family RNA polymerase sigma factor [Polyangiaceae bacterium]|nr:sigma-70 family RNA polymerase sigma factor [Polyangiaceae bacterium]
MSDPAEELDDDALFAAVLARKAAGERIDKPLSVLLSRWRRPALYVIRRIQQSYRRGGEDDQEELLQDAAIKLLERGLGQYRGTALDESGAARATSSRTFFLRIVKHTAIDHYRRHYEELASAHAGEDEPETPGHEVNVAVERARSEAERDEAAELYWRAFERLRAEHPKEAEAWDLYHHRDLDDHVAVANELGITVVNSYKRISRAQAHLRLFLLELKS